MKKASRTIITITVCLLILLTVSMACQRKETAPQVTRNTVRIAANLPLTGDLGIVGKAVQEGANLAVEELDKNEPQSPKLIIDWQDNAGDPSQAVTIMQQQYLKPVDIYISGLKPQTMAIMDQIIKKGTPHFVYILDPYINLNAKNNFRTLVNYKIEPPAYLDYAKKVGAKKVAIIYIQLPHTTDEFEKLIIPGFKAQGINDILVEPFDFAKADFKDIAIKLKQFSPDLIIVNGFQAHLVAIVRAFRPQGLIGDGNFIATYDMLDAATVLSPEELEGIRQVAPVMVTQPDSLGVKGWRDRFKAKYNKETLYYHAFAYDMILAIHDAAKRLELPATPEQWVNALRATNIQGITGPIRFDEDGSIITPVEVGVYRAGKLIPDKE